MIIALNHKDNFNKEEFLSYQEKMKKLDFTSHIIMCPTFLNINLFQLDKLELGAQDVSKEGNGAHTGEISAKDLKNSNVKYVIIGHSERRKDQRETYEDIHKKLKEALDYQLTPILCIGETKEEREDNKVEEVLKEELATAMKELSQEERKSIIIAYEPIWAIGTGIIPSLEQIDEVIKLIKREYPMCSVLYGGSVNQENIVNLKQLSSVDGYLLGGLSLKPEDLQIFINELERQ